jgi:integrase
LNLYRLHLRDGKCIGNHPERSQSYEGQEKKKGWKKCECPIQASGTLGGKFLRKATGRNDWVNARAWALLRQEADSWEVTAVPLAVHPVKEAVNQHVPTTKDAVDQFLIPYKRSGSINTWRGYKHALYRLSKYGEQIREDGQPVAILVTDWRKATIRDLRNGLTCPKLSSRQREMTIIRQFFWFCVESEWIEDNPAMIRTPRTCKPEDREDRQRYPFTNDEIARSMVASETYLKDADPWRTRWHGEDIADFIQVGIHTGLRISDLSNFNIDRLSADNQCNIRALKNGKWVTHELPSWLAERIRVRAEKFGPYIFGRSDSKDPSVHPCQWRKRLQRLWKRCEVDGFKWERTPTPHRLRHTFARILLQTPGVTVRDVAELMGDTEDTIREHYAAWVPERQERLTKVMREAFKDSKPPAYLRPKLIA